MQALECLTVVLKAPAGGTLAQVQQYIQQCIEVEQMVAIGNGLALISACSDRDALEELHLLESQLALAEAAIKRGVRPSSGLRIDAWIATVQNARRYEWLRERACIEAPGGDLQATHGDRFFTGAELDHEIDSAMRLEILREQQRWPAQPPGQGLRYHAAPTRRCRDGGR